MKTVCLVGLAFLVGCATLRKRLPRLQIYQALDKQGGDKR